jgi:peptide/nickel transport system substrate-binding protein
MYSGLITLGKNLEVEPELAKSWNFSKDCLTLDFQLREDVKWHDGKPFTADDVVFTWEATMDPRTPSSYKSDFQDVERVEKTGKYAVRIIYKQPYAKALTSWGVTILPKHLLESYVKAGKIKEAPQNWSAPVGTGPYRFQEMKSGEKIVLVANPDYFRGRPPISRIVYRVIPSQATIFLEVKAMGVDVANLTALQYRRQTEYPAFAKEYNKFRYPGAGYTYFGFNLKDPRRRPARAPGLGPRHRQAGAARGRGARARHRGHRALPPGPLGEQPRRQRCSLRPQEGGGAVRRGRVEAQWSGDAGEGRQALHLRAAHEPGQR